MAIARLQERYGTSIPLRQMVSYRLSRLQAKLNAQATKILKENGDLTLMQWRILVMLDLYDEATIARIVRETEFDKGLLSRTAKTLIQKGLIATKSIESDLRQHHLSMTEKGRTVFDKAFVPMRGRQEKLLNSMTEQQRENLFDAFEKIEKSLDEMKENE